MVNKARLWVIALFFGVVLSILGASPSHAQTYPFFGCGVCATATPASLPTVIRAAFLVQPAASQLPDPGFTPLDSLAQAVDFNQDPTDPTGSCTKGSTNFLCYRYENFALNPCQTFAERDVWAAMNSSEEAAFIHEYPGGITTANRMPNPNTPTATPCPSPNVGTTNGGVWQPLDNTLANAVNVAMSNTGTNYFPPGYHAMFEDTPLTTCEWAAGTSAAAQITSTEYGIGYNSGNTQICNVAAIGSHSVGTDYATAIGTWIGRLTYPVWLNSTFPCCGDPSGCSVIASGHCHDPFYAGYIDDNYGAILHNLYVASKGNLHYGLMENAIMHKYNGTTFPIADALALISYINTAATFENDSSITGLTLVDEEYGYGQGGPGDLSGSVAIQELITAMQGLVADPSTGIPDRIIPEYVGITCAGATKISNNPCAAGQVDGTYFFNETLVPVSPEHTVSKFVWNGTTQTLGGGCVANSTTPTSNGDTGGAIGLLVQCPGDSTGGGVYVQQYRNLFINGVSYGPAAYIVNTSNTTENIVSGWFTGDPISSYNYRLAIQAGSLTSVPYGVGSVTLTCTYTTNCTGSNTPSSNMASFAGNGTDILCGPCGVVLFNQN